MIGRALVPEAEAGAEAGAGAEAETGAGVVEVRAGEEAGVISSYERVDCVVLIFLVNRLVSSVSGPPYLYPVKENCCGDHGCDWNGDGGGDVKSGRTRRRLLRSLRHRRILWHLLRPHLHPSRGTHYSRCHSDTSLKPNWR